MVPTPSSLSRVEHAYLTYTWGGGVFEMEKKSLFGNVYY